jgi:hypothetical protein
MLIMFQFINYLKKKTYMETYHLSYIFNTYKYIYISFPKTMEHEKYYMYSYHEIIFTKSI